jgi:membrane protein DedA with SNARE-associated domain
LVAAADIVAWVFQFVADNGLFALVFVVALDSSMLLPIIPGELLLVAAVQQFAPDRAHLFLTIMAATIGATLGSVALYAVARWGGRGFIERHPKLFLMNPTRRKKLERLFERPSGQLLVFFFRFLPFLRVVVSLPAGLANMPFLRFIILSFLGNLLFNAGLMWFTFESRRPGSAVALYVDRFRGSVIDPAWGLVLLHWLFVTAAVVAILVFLVLLRAGRLHRRPDQEAPAMNLLGAVVTIGLLVAGILLLVGLWAAPLVVFGTIDHTGWDVETQFADLPGGAYLVLGLVGALAVSLALMLVAVQRSANVAKQRVASASGPPPRESVAGKHPMDWRRGPY